MAHMLMPSGSAFLLIPATEHVHFQDFFGQTGLKETRICSVRKNGNSAASRLFLSVQKENISPYNSEIIVHNKDGSLSDEAVRLLRRFNLFL
jgi:tRNA1(Val) A37 N6-methylase TrmN6